MIAEFLKNITAFSPKLRGRCCCLRFRMEPEPDQRVVDVMNSGIQTEVANGEVVVEHVVKVRINAAAFSNGLRFQPESGLVERHLGKVSNHHSARKPTQFDRSLFA